MNDRSQPLARSLSDLQAVALPSAALAELLDHMADGVVILGAHSIVRANRALATALGVSPEAFVGTQRQDWPLLDAAIALPLADGFTLLFVAVEALPICRSAEPLLLAALLENSPLGFAFFDREYRYVQINAALAAINGYSIEAHLDRSINDLLPVNARTVVPILSKIFTTGQALQNIEVNGETPAEPGQQRYWLTSFFPVCAPDGAVLYVGAVVFDITMRKEMELSLRHSEERFRTMANVIPQLVWQENQCGEVVFYNQRWHDFVANGLPGSAFPSWQHVVHPADRNEVAVRYAHSQATGSDFQAECRLRRYDGLYCWHSVQLVPLMHEHAALAWFGTATDIDRTKREAQRLAFLNDSAALLTSSLDYGEILAQVSRLLVPGLADYTLIHTLHPDGTLRQMLHAHSDPAVEALLETLGALIDAQPLAALGPLGAAVTKGQPVLVLGPELESAHPEIAAVVAALAPTAQILAPLIARGEVRGVLTLAMGSSGRSYAQSDVDGLQEVALRVALALDNARLYEEARELAKERETMLAIASHELKNPLTALIGYIALLDRRIGQNPDISERERRHLGQIRTQSLRLNTMIDMLLDASRLERGQMVLQRGPVDLTLLLSKLIAEFEPALRGHELTLTEADAPLILEGDEIRLEQVFRNLLSNAIKYSPEGGTIRVAIDHTIQEVQVAISDSGIGIPAAELPRLFLRFARIRNAASEGIGGLGLGLYVVKEIINLHAGTITVASVEGQGTTFTVTLPLVLTHIA